MKEWGRPLFLDYQRADFMDKGSKVNIDLQKELAKKEARLQQLERELEIEAALERVRAASMAMHKTEEIEDVVVILFKQLKELKLEFYQSWISIIHLDQGYIDVWMSPQEGFDVLLFS